MLAKKDESFKGIIALVLWVLFAQLIGVIIRYLDEFFLVFQQVFLRSFLAFLLSLLIYYLFFPKLDFSKITKKDKIFIFLRSSFHIVAVFLWIMALKNTTLANATLIASIPATTILGMIIFGEKFTKKSFFYLSLSLFGAIIISFDENFKIGVGELYALGATFMFSLYSLARKKISDHLGDREISSLSILVTSLFALIAILIWERDFSTFYIDFNPLSILYIFIGALLFLGISFCCSYGFKRVNSIKAGSIEYLEIFFAIILGFLFFSEIPTIKDISGGTLIVLGAYLILKDKQEHKK